MDRKQSDNLMGSGNLGDLGVDGLILKMHFADCFTTLSISRLYNVEWCD